MKKKCKIRLYLTGLMIVSISLGLISIHRDVKFSAEIVKLLIKSGADVNIQDKYEGGLVWF